MSKEELETALLSLPVEDRAEFAHKLIASIDGAEADNLDGAWMLEVDRRAAEVLSGEADLVPGEEVFRNAFARRHLK